MIPCVMVYNYIVSGLFLMFFWCRCMAINVSVQYNGGLPPDIILLTQSRFHRGTRLNATHEEVLYLQPLIPPKPFLGPIARCLQNFRHKNFTFCFLLSFLSPIKNGLDLLIDSILT